MGRSAQGPQDLGATAGQSAGPDGAAEYRADARQEPAGLKITNGSARRRSPPTRTTRWDHPHGQPRRRRRKPLQRARSRPEPNYPGTWSSGARNGRRPASEPETRAVMRFVKRLQPNGVLSFHQPWNTTLSVCDRRSVQWVRRVATHQTQPAGARVQLREMVARNAQPMDREEHRELVRDEGTPTAIPSPHDPFRGQRRPW